MARAALTRAGLGEVQRWFDRDVTGTITLPGSTDEARLGKPNPARPTLDGLYRLFPYEGPAWFQYNLMIPGSWKGKRVSLVLERVHWETKVWIDGKLVPGTQNSLIAPHVHDLGTVGGTRRLTIRVDNTRKIDLGGFVSILYEGTQTNWNGLVGSMEIRAVDPVAIDDLQVYPDLERKRAKVRGAAVERAWQAGDGPSGTLGAGTEWAHRRGERPCRGAAQALGRGGPRAESGARREALG